MSENGKEDDETSDSPISPLNSNIEEVDWNNFDENGWKELIENENTAIKQLIPYLTYYENRIKEHRANTRAQKVSMYDFKKDMFQQLLDGEEDHRTDLEQAQKHTEELLNENRKLKKIIEVNNDNNDYDDKIEKFIQSEETLQKTNEELKNEIINLKEELIFAKTKLKDLTTNNDTIRRNSVTSVENEYMSKMLKLESEYEKKLQDKENIINDLKSKTIGNTLQLPNENSNESFDDNTTPISDLDTNEVEDDNYIQSPLFPSTPVLDMDTLPDNIDKLKQLISDYATKLRKSEVRYDELELKYQNLLSKSEDDDPLETIKKLEQTIEELQKEQTKISHTARDSLSQNMMKKMLDKEFEFSSELEQLKKENEELRNQLYNKGDDDDFVFDNQTRDSEDENEAINYSNMSKNELIEQINKLNKKIDSLKQRVNETEKTRRNSVQFLSKEMMTQLLETEEEHKKDIKDWKKKLKEKKKIKELKLELENKEMTRRNSLTTVSSNMFQKLLESERQRTEEKQKLSQEIEKLTNENFELKAKSELADKQRRGSIHELHQSMFKKMLEAESEHTQEVKKLKKRIKKFKKKLKSNNIQLSEESDDDEEEEEEEEEEEDYDDDDDEEDNDDEDNENNNDNDNFEDNTHKTNNGNERINQLYENRIKELEDEAKILRKKLDDSERTRRNSITQLNETNWNNLLEAEEDFRKEVSKLRKRVEYLEASKLSLIELSNQQINLMRNSIKNFNNNHKHTKTTSNINTENQNRKTTKFFGIF